jgi:hypothetical protein
MKASRRIKTALAAVLSIIIIFVGGIFIYASDYYRAEADALSCIKYTDTVTVTQSDGAYIFSPDKAECGLIFYPGGKVEYSAYAPLLSELAKENILCILIEMPLNLAVLNVDAATEYFDEFPEIDKWYIGGHSLGGSMAASYASENSDKLDGLILLASYSTADLKASGLDVISVYGSNDGVLNMEKYNEHRQNLPSSTVEKVIEGGCHAYFGSYGTQKNDGTPTVSRNEQINETVKIITDTIRK